MRHEWHCSFFPARLCPGKGSGFLLPQKAFAHWPEDCRGSSAIVPERGPEDCAVGSSATRPPDRHQAAPAFFQSTTESGIAHLASFDRTTITPLCPALGGYLQSSISDYGARTNTQPCTMSYRTSPDLARVVAGWEGLPLHVRNTIVLLVDTCPAV